TSSGSAGPPRPIATMTTRRSAARMRATCPATAVFPIRLPSPITASDGVPTGSSRGGAEGETAAPDRGPEGKGRGAPSTRAPRPEDGLVREVDHEIRVCRVERLDERDAVIVSTAQLLGPAHEQRTDDVVRQRLERVPHDRREVLAVDERDRAIAHNERTSSSIFAVYFSYVFVSVENWMIRSCPWNGYRRHTSTCVPSTSTTL